MVQVKAPIGVPGCLYSIKAGDDILLIAGVVACIRVAPEVVYRVLGAPVGVVIGVGIRLDYSARAEATRVGRQRVGERSAGEGHHLVGAVVAGGVHTHNRDPAAGNSRIRPRSEVERRLATRAAGPRGVSHGDIAVPGPDGASAGIR